MKKRLSGVSETLSTSLWVMKIYFAQGKLLASIYLFGALFSPIASIISAYIFAYVIDQIIFLYNSQSAQISDFVPIIVIFLGFDFLSNTISNASGFSKRILNRRIDFALRKQLQEHLRSLGVSKLESPEISNKAQRFTEQITTIPDNMAFTMSFVGDIVGIMGSFIFVASIIPQIIPLYLIVIAITASVDQAGLRKLWFLDRNTTEWRRAFWFTSARLSDPNDLKELLLTKGYKLLRKKYDEFARYTIDETTKVRRSWFWKLLIARALQTVALGAGFVLLLQKTLRDQLSIGNLTFQFRMLTTFSGSMNDLFSDFVAMRESTIKIKDAKELLELYSADLDGEVALSNYKNPSEIKFSNVGFHYANAKRNALTNINLLIKPGEKIAIVGENGAGKTTLVKLITRLYRTSTGQISIDETDINNLKIETWYKKLGVLFQDYNIYSHLTLAENVSIGDTSKKPTKEKINKSLEKANAKSFTDLYDDGLDQILSERFKGGVRPSTGQWQKIAIARFFYRNAPVLILDEPTASIDAVAEAEIFNNIYKFVKNKTVIIISHRFSTVRNADRIIVLDKGQIIEEGSHEKLLKLGGKYANAFKLQAKGYE